MAEEACARGFSTSGERPAAAARDDSAYTSNYWLLALIARLINELIETQTLDLDVNIPHGTLNCSLTLAGALNKMAYILRIGHFEDDIESSISVIALHLKANHLSFRFKSESGAGGLLHWHNQAFMPSTTSSIHYTTFEMDGCNRLNVQCGRLARA